MKSKILIIDERRLHRSRMAKNLGQLGFMVHEVPHFILAMEQFEFSSGDFIILDMGSVCALRACQEIRANTHSIRQPTIFMTALNTTKNKRLAIAAGADEWLDDPMDFEELALRIELCKRRKKQHQKLAERLDIQTRLTMIDPLTQTYNRRYLDAKLPDILNRNMAQNGNIGIMALDIDHFKLVNDRYGHLAGDHVLQRISDILRAHLRPGDIIARTGGEEFLIVAPAVAKHQIEEIAQRLIGQIARARFDQFPELQITASIGLSNIANKGGWSIADLLAQTDHALYQAKRTGRNQVIIAA